MVEHVSRGWYGPSAARQLAHARLRRGWAHRQRLARTATAQPEAGQNGILNEFKKGQQRKAQEQARVAANVGEEFRCREGRLQGCVRLDSTVTVHQIDGGGKSGIMRSCGGIRGSY